MRARKTIINSTFNIVSQAVQLVMSFIIRNLFIKYIGIDYLGLNGLFSNILSALNLFDLGIGTAITYHLYKPMAVNDKEQIAGLMRFYKKMYYAIGCVILFFGTLLMLFIQVFIKEPIYDIGFLRMVFFIQLLGTASTYFLAYKRTLLFVDQKNYIAAFIDTSINIIMMAVRVVTIIVFKSYIIYLVLILVQYVIANVVISFVCNRIYPYLKQMGNDSGIDKKGIRNNLKNIVVEKIVGYIYYSTDNIIISKFVGLASVGLLSNYNLIVATVQTFFVQITNSVQASLGNLVHTEKDKEHVNDVFYKYYFFCFLCTSFCIASFIALTRPFIEIWLGNAFVLPEAIIIILSVTYYTSTIRIPLSQILTVNGMFRYTKNVAIVSAIFNISISLVLVNYIGIAGTLIGTMASDMIYWTGQIYLLVNKMSFSVKKYFARSIQYIVITLFESAVTVFACNAVFPANDLWSFAGKIAFCLLIPNALNLLLFWNTKELGYFKALLIAVLKKRVKVNKNG